MNGERLDYMMRSDEFTSKIWKMFLAPDIVLTGKPKTPFPHLYIANTAPTSTGGEHWCVLLVFKDYCEFFDSFETPSFHLCPDACIFESLQNHHFQRDSSSK